LVELACLASGCSGADEDRGVSGGRLVRICRSEFQAVAARVLRVTEVTSRPNVLLFEDEEGRAAPLEQILGRTSPPG
jgi:hypothetical protein